MTKNPSPNDSFLLEQACIRLRMVIKLKKIRDKESSEAKWEDLKKRSSRRRICAFQ